METSFDKLAALINEFGFVTIIEDLAEYCEGSSRGHGATNPRLEQAWAEYANILNKKILGKN